MQLVAYLFCWLPVLLPGWLAGVAAFWPTRLLACLLLGFLACWLLGVLACWPDAGWMLTDATCCTAGICLFLAFLAFGLLGVLGCWPDAGWMLANADCYLAGLPACSLAAGSVALFMPCWLRRLPCWLARLIAYSHGILPMSCAVALLAYSFAGVQSFWLAGLMAWKLRQERQATPRRQEMGPRQPRNVWKRP